MTARSPGWLEQTTRNVAMTAAADSRTSVTLLNLLRDDEKQRVGWEEFVLRYRPKILGWCRKWGLQEADAEDVTQSVLVKLTEKMRSFRYDPSFSFRRWLRTVTHNTCIDYSERWRKQRGTGNSEVLQMLQSLEARADLAARLEETYDQELLALAMDLGCLPPDRSGRLDGGGRRRPDRYAGGARVRGQAPRAEDAGTGDPRDGTGGGDAWLATLHRSVAGVRDASAKRR